MLIGQRKLRENSYVTQKIEKNFKIYEILK